MRKMNIYCALMLTVALTITGCGSTVVTDTVNTENVEAEQSVEENEADTTEEAVEEAKEEEKNKDEEAVEEGSEEINEEEEDIEVDINNISSVEYAKILKFGWNLGNTLDATSAKNLSSETSWGMPLTTQEIISYVKSTGINTIRIPVSWGNHTDANYQIDEEWMARVKEVVDYAYNEEMFVIINSHHDNDFYYPSEENMDNAKKYIATIWTQIAEEFKDYDNHLVFESMNEPRLAGTDIEWWFPASDPTGRAAIGRICELNQVFVDTVRATDGNNPNRFIMVPSYAASPDFALNSAFSMPEDPSDRIMVSIHAYTPYDFAGKADGYSEWDGSKTGEFTFMGKLMSTFILNGYGVVIGEFGATNKDNLESRCKWASGYTSKAQGYGIPCILWDNQLVGVGEENFGMIDRNNLKVYFPELLDSYMMAYK